MNSTAAHSDFVATPPAAVSRWPLFACCIFLGAIWLQVIHQLQSEWSFNPQYAYGWTVPFAAIFLVWKRWPGRPQAQLSSRRFVATLFFLGALIVFVPLRFVAEANPDWRLLSWGLASLAATASLCLLFVGGGWPWLRYFAFPFIFFLVAVPWPTQFEQMVIQNLMRAVTSINITFLDIAGVPALQHGNVVEVGSGLIGIEEACSGVRSLQATLMLSLFLGDLYSFDAVRRIILVVAGALLAFVCNLFRTAILVWLGAKHGANAVHAWHDPAGFSILIVCLFGLWLLSLYMRKGAEDRNPPRKIDNRTSTVFAFSPTLLIAAAAWLLFAEGAVQLWYRSHQSPMAALRWSVQWPSSQNNYQSVPIAPEAEGLLHYNDGGGASWQSADNKQWMMYFFRWLPGRTAARFVKIHRPDICLPASGMTIVNDDGIRLLDVNGVKLPVRSYRFDDHGAPLHVFYCYWDARSSYETAAAAAEEDWSASGRIRAAVRGKRELGAQMLEVVVWGFENDAEAAAALQQQLSQIISAG